MKYHVAVDCIVFFVQPLKKFFQFTKRIKSSMPVIFITLSRIRLDGKDYTHFKENSLQSAVIISNDVPKAARSV